MTLAEKIAEINNWPNRASAQPLLAAVKCKYCGCELPVQVQDLSRAKAVARRTRADQNPDKLFTCIKAECRIKKSIAYNEVRANVREANRQPD